jgi:hypothetical protein
MTFFAIMAGRGAAHATTPGLIVVALEACRVSSAFEQFVLVGGDAGMGHFFYPHPIPVTETQKHSAYPGCYVGSGGQAREAQLRARQSVGVAQ